MMTEYVGSKPKTGRHSLLEGTSHTSSPTVDANVRDNKEDVIEVCTKSSIDDLSSQAHKLIEEINIKRRQDSQLLAEFRTVLEKQTVTTCKAIEDGLYEVYSRHGDLIQKKLQALCDTLDRISKLETELGQFRASLDMLYQDVK